MTTNTQRQRYIDFHTHTFYSDGIGTPDFNVRLARLSALDYLAITDHDKIDGYYEAKATGEKWQLQVIPGVEVSTDKYHILGLGINPEDIGFLEFLAKSAEQQRKVCEARMAFLQGKGIPITLEKLLRRFPDSRLGKMNILYTMVEDRECQEYFMRTYGRLPNNILYKQILKTQGEKEGGKEVVDKDTSITAKIAIEAIHSAGGLAFIAHPYFEVKSMEEMDVLLEYGLDGLEIQPKDNGRNEPFREYAKQHNLLVTYGSDWHGGIFGRMMLDTNGENILSERLAEALKIDLGGR
jgi:predicted metal-dependent phosphoesterase TrpH